jgi:hypothetical protein
MFGQPTQHLTASIQDAPTDLETSWTDAGVTPIPDRRGGRASQSGDVVRGQQVIVRWCG